MLIQFKKGGHSYDISNISKISSVSNGRDDDGDYIFTVEYHTDAKNKHFYDKDREMLIRKKEFIENKLGGVDVMEIIKV
jgi:hypothetical protein